MTDNKDKEKEKKEDFGDAVDEFRKEVKKIVEEKHDVKAEKVDFYANKNYRGPDEVRMREAHELALYMQKKKAD